MFIRHFVIALSMAGVFIPMPALQAAKPQVVFDIASLVDCRDVTTSDFSAVHPREKLIEARLTISTLIRDGGEDLTELFLRIESPEHSARVFDYLPKTTLSSQYAGNVGIEEKSEQSTSLGLNAAGAYGPLSATNAALSAGDKAANCRRYELLPPLETVAASGTIDRENGVYFKLRPTPRTSLEGARELRIIFRVSRNWRADYIAVRCQAFHREKQLGMPARECLSNGSRSFLVALYLEGDAAAQTAAAKFVREETRLRGIASSHQQQIHESASASPVHDLAVKFSLTRPRIPGDWLDQIMTGPDRGTVNFMGYLPNVVRESAMDYLAARRQMRTFRDAPSSSPESTARR